MKIEFDPDKRLRTIEERGLDFEHIVDVFDNFNLVRTDDRKDYGEVRQSCLARCAAGLSFACGPAEVTRSALFR